MKKIKIFIASVSIISTLCMTACNTNKTSSSLSSFDDPLFQELVLVEFNSLMLQEHTGIKYERSLIGPSGSTSDSFYFKKLKDEDYEECFIHCDYNYSPSSSSDYFINDYYIKYVPNNQERTTISKKSEHYGLQNYIYASIVGRVSYCDTSVFTTTKETDDAGVTTYRLDFSNYKEIFESFIDYYIVPKSFSIKITVINGLLSTGYVSFSMNNIIFKGSFSYDYQPFAYEIPPYVKELYKNTANPQ